MRPGGYAWWYLDALSGDGRHGLSIIGFVGSVFSPYYVWSGHRDAEDHCAFNVALYSPGARRWTMTERGRGAVQRDDAQLRIGPSAMRWDGDTLSVHIDEVGVPLPRRVRGLVRLRPEGLTPRAFDLDPAGRHRWWPAAPRASVEVEMTSPALRWRGSGYLDTNEGDRPLQQDFLRWDWSRAHLADGSSAILYDVTRRDAASGSVEGPQLAVRCSADGGSTDFTPPPRQPLPGCFWGMARHVQSDAQHPPRLLRTLEDSPFYARSLVRAHWLGEPIEAVHESLSLLRFASPLVRLMLPFRMPRRA